MHENHRLVEGITPGEQILPSISRRDVLGLFLAAMLAPLLVGCGLDKHAPAGSQGAPTATAPPVLQPAEVIGPENAGRVVPLAALDVGRFQVKTVAWSPDARFLAVGAYRTLQLWDPVTGKQVAAMSGHSKDIWWVSWSPDGSRLASAGEDGTVRLWDASAHTALNVLQSHSPVVLSVVWSPDGKSVLAGNQDGTLELWDASTGSHHAVWTGQPPEPSGKTGAWALAVFSAVWSPDGQRIASTREDNIVQLWGAATGEVQNVLRTEVGSANIVAWSPDGRTLAVSNDVGSVQLWDAQTGKIVTVLEGHPGAGWVNMITWSPDGRMLASTRENALVQLWDTRQGKELLAMHGHRNEVWAAAWSPDGLRVASGSNDGTVRLWGVH